MNPLTFGTEFPFETERANAFSVRTVTVTVAIGHLALVVSQIAFLAFPPGIALAFAVDVLASLTAQHRANTLRKKKFN